MECASMCHHDAHLLKVFQGVLLNSKVWLEQLGYFSPGGTLENAPAIDAVTSLRRFRMTTWTQPVKLNHRMSWPVFNPKLDHSAEQANPYSLAFNEMQFSCHKLSPWPVCQLQVWDWFQKKEILEMGWSMPMKCQYLSWVILNLGWHSRPCSQALLSDL